MVVLDLHTLLLAPPANDVGPELRAERLPSLWRQRRESAALVVVLALRARGVTAGQCARWWQETPWQALERLAGRKPLCVEHLAALPVAVRETALEALRRAA